MSKEWEEEKEEWRKKIEALTIPEDKVEQLIPKLEHEIDTVYQEASFKYTYYKSKYENLQDRIKAIKKAYGDEGSNKQEREANAYRMLMFYPSGEEEDPDAKNLITLRNNIRKRYYFFRDYVMDNLKTKSNRLSNNIGAAKVSARIEGAYGS